MEPTALEIHEWTKQLAIDDWIIQSVALEELGKRKVEKAVPEIRKILNQGKSSWLKGRAMLALAKILGKEMVPTAQEATKGKDAIIRRAALQTLDLVGGKTSVPLARELLKDPVMEVRSMAAALYASEFPGEAWPTVERLTRLDKTKVSSDLLRALAHIGSEEALKRMEQLFHEPDTEKGRGREIIKALAVTEDEGTSLLARLTVHYNSGQAEFQLGKNLLLPREKKRVSSLIKEMIQAEDTSFLGNTASLMAEICPTHELGDLMSDSWTKRNDLPQEVIRAGLVALSKIEPVRYKSFFTHYLTSKDPETRSIAVRCRGLIPDKGMFEVFRPYVHDEDARVAQAALESLRQTPFDSSPQEGLLTYLAKSFRSPEEKITRAALGLFAKRGEMEEFDSALRMLQPFLEEGGGSKREAAAKALAEVCSNSRDPDIAAVQGFVGHWDIVGPFLNDNKDIGFKKVYPPEEDDDAKSYKAEYKWEFGGGQGNRELELTWGKTSVGNVQGEMHVAAQMPLPIRNAVAYAKTDILSDSERIARITLESRERTSQKVWINGQIVGEFTLQHNELGGTLQQRREGGPIRIEKVKVNLKKGSNRLMVKTTTFGGNWWLRVRVIDEKKNEKAKGVTFATSTLEG